MKTLLWPRPEAREISEVNVVPLADVSLVLLIILLVLSPAMRQSMLHVRTAGQPAKAEIPAAEDLLTPRPAELVLVVGLTPGGFTLGRQDFPTAAALSETLRAELSRRADKKVFLSPHPEAPMSLVVAALEAIKACGAQSVALVQAQEDKPDGTIRAAAPAP